MTTLTKVAYSITDGLHNLKERICNDGHFCESVVMALLSTVTIWVMIEAMRPLI